MPAKPSSFIWYELTTSDPDAATAFYSEVVGWAVKDSGIPGMDYRMLDAGGTMIGGVMTLPADASQAGMKPCWFGYVSVPSVEQAIAEITGAGGRVQMPAMDVPEVGRIAMVADPQGALLYVMTPLGDGESAAFSPFAVGHAGWNELHAEDGHAAFAFYSKQFGWGKTDEMDMGPLGKYILFNTGGDAVGGMMTKHAPSPPHWLFYFNVDDITAAGARVTKAGGAIVNGPHQVPGGQWIIQCQDPQKVMFALVSQEKT